MEGSSSIAVNLEVIDGNSLEQSCQAIGAGGFSQVFKARHHQWGRDVAIKILAGNGSRPYEDAVCEAELMRRAESPYVMKVLGVFRGSMGSRAFIHHGLVMEVMERGSLYDLQTTKEFSVTAAKAWGYDFSHLTLNTNTAYKTLSLSENNMVATRGRGPPHPDHPDRFDVWDQVLCTEGLTGPCYWEVERNGYVYIAVTYGGISRKGGGDDCGLGWNDKSWSLFCYDNSYSVRHNSKSTVLPVRSSGSNRVAVYLDCPLGTLSFYEVCSDTLTHLFTYTFTNTFSEPLYAGFRLYRSSSSSVRLCEQR